MSDYFRDGIPILFRGTGFAEEVRVAEIAPATSCYRIREFFYPVVDEQARCIVCLGTASQHTEGPCTTKQSQFLAPGRCISCGLYTREHRP